MCEKVFAENTFLHSRLLSIVIHLMETRITQVCLACHSPFNRKNNCSLE